ncbi:MAG: alpha/beta fold hydrolase [Rhodocyclaceae bacterium]|nr:alpha/beta fold hydrolase [Rhodocyclaceae bacterium]MCP5239429.1 alpha/beta fold hydrolase [Zoogloeaceae bacterium]MCP5255534.1 alpha/beta fold hydrolase [Zoogloeaceae bacterium]MCW5615225.1 alpha/beta fold hydrolase [Rhodocyclaceae bacterium]
MNTTTESRPRLAQHENSVPFFWPFTAAATMIEAGEKLVARNLDFALEAEKIDFGLHPAFASPNRVLLDLHTLRLRDFSVPEASGIPTIVDAPFAGHSSTIADYHKGQSLVETLLASGLQRVLVTDWKSATPEMKDYDIDHYLAELLVCIDELGGRVNLVGLCQGGWMSAMVAARFPEKVNRLVLAGSPIDTDAGNGPIRELAHTLPVSFYEDLVKMGSGLMEGRFMLQGWKAMHPDQQYVQKYLELYEHMNDPDYLNKTETFEAWYENPIDLPGRWYLQAITQLFKENLLAKGRFVGLGKTLKLAHITCPTYLLAGESDDITTKEQVFAARELLGTPKDQIVSTLCPGGHIGLFMGSRTLAQTWPEIGKWLVAGEAG